MLAVIKTGGKQYIVKPNDKIKIEKIKDQKEGEKIVFDNVLLLEKNGKTILDPASLKKVNVSGKIVEQGKDKKITILKYKPKTRYKVKKGHRQQFMRVEIEKINS